MRDPAQSKKLARPAEPDVRARAEALRAKAAASSADPILAVIKQGRGLFAAARAEYRAPDAQGRGPAVEALFGHFRDVLLVTRPTTAFGAVALARYVQEFRRLTGYRFEALDADGPDDHFHDDALRGACMKVRDEILGGLDDRLWALFPDLYGPEGDHPRWALASHMAPLLVEAKADR